MKADDDGLINRLLNETYQKASPSNRDTVSNVVNLEDYFNSRENFYEEKSKTSEQRELFFTHNDFQSFRRISFNSLKIDIPKGIGLLKIDSSFEEDICFEIVDTTFKEVISKELGKEVTHIMLRDSKTGIFLEKDLAKIDYKKVG